MSKLNGAAYSKLVAAAGETARYVVPQGYYKGWQVLQSGLHLEILDRAGNTVCTCARRALP